MTAGPLVGAWTRTGLIVGGARVPEPCDVLWLQTTDTFADIRIPRQPTSPGHGPAAQFYRPRAFAGVEIAFREEWELISAPGDPAQATVSPGWIRVTIGPLRIDVIEGRPDGCFRAERQQRRGDRWETVGVVTDA